MSKSSAVMMMMISKAIIIIVLMDGRILVWHIIITTLQQTWIIIMMMSNQAFSGINMMTVIMSILLSIIIIDASLDAAAEETMLKEHHRHRHQLPKILEEEKLEAHKSSNYYSSGRGRGLPCLFLYTVVCVNTSTLLMNYFSVLHRAKNNLTNKERKEKNALEKQIGKLLDREQEQQQQHHQEILHSLEISDLGALSI